MRLLRLTPEQVDQSFAMLEELRPHIQSWWNSGTDWDEGFADR